jgi:hypothetical protein
VPLLATSGGGEAFRRTRRNKVKTELLIFLTPHVAEGPAELEPMTDDELKGTKLTPNAVAPGMFQEHMGGAAARDAPADPPLGLRPGAVHPHDPARRAARSAVDRPASEPNGEGGLERAAPLPPGAEPGVGGAE